MGWSFAVLFAVFLRGTAGKLAQWTGVAARLAVAAVLVTLVALVIVGAALIGPSSEVLESTDSALWLWVLGQSSSCWWSAC